MSEWEPIETLEKDGRHVLVYLESELLKCRTAVAYFAPNVSWVGGMFEFDAPKVTHWAPLPDAPK